MKHLESQAERSEGLANCLIAAMTSPSASSAGSSRRRRRRDDETYVRWVDVSSYAVTLNLTPLSVASIFQRQMAGHPRAWIFTSATLAVGRDFGHYQGELGLAEAETGLWGSPFDYDRHALLYAPPDMPDPNSPLYHEAVAGGRLAGDPRRRGSGGGAFVLCTSLRAMRRIHELLKERLAHEALELPLLLQGEGSKSELLERFRFLGNAILVASQSFWEGVDVRGEALSLVVIDKLPFAPPDDPVLAARIDHLKRQGRNAFFEYQLPRAVISMKQGAGRLIRDETDRGVLMICDPRLIGKPYGKAHLALAAADAAHARDRGGRSLLRGLRLVMDSTTELAELLAARPHLFSAAIGPARVRRSGAHGGTGRCRGAGRCHAGLSGPGVGLGAGSCPARGAESGRLLRLRLSSDAQPDRS